jgi:dolichol-phosphate mannosyltransferase
MELSVVVPVHNEAENVRPLIGEIRAALDGVVEYEIVYVDDGSSDATPERLAEAGQGFPPLRVLRHRRQSGQSTALWTGVRHARAPWIATLDGDGQNDPADIPKLLALALDPDRKLDLVAGHRVTRKDSATQRLASRIANGVRSRMLRDDTPDTGCGSRYSRARSSWRCHISTTCTGSCQRWCSGAGGGSVRSRSTTGPASAAGRTMESITGSGWGSWTFSG